MLAVAVLVFLSWGGAAARAGDGPVPLNARAALYLDPAATADIDAVTRPPLRDAFTPLGGPRVLFGFSPAAHWFRLAVADLPDMGGPRLLEVATPALDRVTLYLPRPGGGWTARPSGDMLPVAGRAVDSRRLVFDLPDDLPPDGQVLVRVRSDGSVRVPLKLWRAADFRRADAVDTVWLAVYAGVFLAMILYNVILFAAVRDRAYLHYVLFWGGFLVAHLTSRGVTQAVLWPGVGGLSNVVVVVSLGWTVAWGARFVGHFLDLGQRAPRLGRLFDGFFWLALAGAAGGLVLPYGPMLLGLLMLGAVLVLTCTVAIPLVYRRGYRPARFLVAAMVFILPGMGLVITANAGWIESTPAIVRLIQLCTMAEPFIFALALADRVKAIEAGAMAAERRARSLQEGFSRALLARQEAVRRQIAGTLHDSVGQDLLVVLNRIGALRRRAAESGAGTGELADLDALTRDTLEEVRGLSHDLHPHQLDRLGLDAALASMFDTVFRDTGIEVDRDLRPVAGHLRPGDDIQLYRLAQEAANNVVKHSGASLCRVRLGLEGGEVALQVADDGRGLPPGDGESGTGGTFGLASMRERAHMMGGRLEIRSRPGQGLRLDVRVPAAAAGDAEREDAP
ncbi:MAG: hypothetical protein H6907_03000 [Hyphomicrobiales bacterium]|nr:hypothetical protein [Hyphomicrobiales bacterium]MCP5370674.1 hypothetical protein [Hyphomicrobiales bacterium]